MVVAATFTIHTQGHGTGQCVMVESGLILTAAHCIDTNTSGGLALGDYKPSTISTTRGRKRPFRAQPLVVETGADVAVLGSLDEQDFSTDADAYQKHFERCKTLRICLVEPEEGATFPVWILTDTGKLVRATAEHTHGHEAKIFISANAPVPGGSSGGPIVNSRGELVAIASNFSENEIEGAWEGDAPLLALALPMWVGARLG